MASPRKQHGRPKPHHFQDHASPPHWLQLVQELKCLILTISQHHTSLPLTFTKMTYNTNPRCPQHPPPHTTSCPTPTSTYNTIMTKRVQQLTKTAVGLDPGRSFALGMTNSAEVGHLVVVWWLNDVGDVAFWVHLGREQGEKRWLLGGLGYQLHLINKIIMTINTP